MWKREQAYFVGPIAASNVIWAEAGKRLFSLSELCRNRRGVLGNPTDPPTPTLEMGAGIIGPHNWLWLHPHRISFRSQPFPWFGLRGHPLGGFLRKEGGQQAGAVVPRSFCALLLCVFSLFWGWGRVRAARTRCRRKPGTAPTPQLLGRACGSQRCGLGAHVCACTHAVAGAG